MVLHRSQAAEATRVDTLKKDAEIARLHDSGVAWRKARIAQLMTQSDSFYMYARLLQMPATKVLPMEQQRRLINALGDMRQAEMRRKKGV